jgi:hypothetical protein
MLDEDRDTLLLKDMAELYRTRGADRIESREIVQSLVAMPDRPWVDFDHGEPFRAVDLARVLLKFGVFPRKWAEGAGAMRTWKRGYCLSDLRDKFARYVSPQQAEPPPESTKLG